MKTLHPARRRFVIGIILLAVTFLTTFQSGAIGMLCARALGFLFGQTGTAMLSVTLFVVGMAFVLPRDFLVRFIRWGMNGREARVDRVVRESRQPIVVEEPAVAQVPPAARMRLDDVRGALKQLGYKNFEYEPLVGVMDPSVPFEVLVKSALKKLQEKRN